MPAKNLSFQECIEWELGGFKPINKYDYHFQNLLVCGPYIAPANVFILLFPGAGLVFNVPAGCFLAYCDCLINHCLTSCYL